MDTIDVILAATITSFRRGCQPMHPGHPRFTYYIGVRGDAYQAALATGLPFMNDAAKSIKKQATKWSTELSPCFTLAQLSPT